MYYKRTEDLVNQLKKELKTKELTQKISYVTIVGILILISVLFICVNNIVNNTNTYTITYHLNGGTNHSENPKAFTIENLDITLQNPTKENYYFVVGI
ncbi:MAG: InlB B-repeat-containing protein [Clostridia bacterium]|nr:InlB B-repeat-containing protein [Clostridia bacterium]